MLIGPGAGTGATGKLKAGVWVEAYVIIGEDPVTATAELTFSGLSGPGGSFDVAGESFTVFEGRADPVGAFAVESVADVGFSGLMINPGGFAVVAEATITGVGNITGFWSVFEVEAQASAVFDGYTVDAEYSGEFHVEAHGDLSVFWSPDVSGGIATAGCQPAPAEAVLVAAAASAGGQDGPSEATGQDDPADVDCIEGPATAIVGYEGDSDA